MKIYRIKSEYSYFYTIKAKNKKEAIKSMLDMYNNMSKEDILEQFEIYVEETKVNFNKKVKNDTNNQRDT